MVCSESKTELTLLLQMTAANTRFSAGEIHFPKKNEDKNKEQLGFNIRLMIKKEEKNVIT